MRTSLNLLVSHICYICCVCKVHIFDNTGDGGFDDELSEDSRKIMNAPLPDSPVASKILWQELCAKASTIKTGTLEDSVLKDNGIKKCAPKQANKKSTTSKPKTNNAKSIKSKSQKARTQGVKQGKATPCKKSTDDKEYNSDTQDGIVEVLDHYKAPDGKWLCKVLWNNGDEQPDVLKTNLRKDNPELYVEFMKEWAQKHGQPTGDELVHNGTPNCNLVHKDVNVKDFVEVGVKRFQKNGALYGSECFKCRILIVGSGKAVPGETFKPSKEKSVYACKKWNAKCPCCTCICGDCLKRSVGV